MPVTSALSRDVYDRFGDPVANELVARIDAAGAANRRDLSALNDLNLVRIETEIVRRVASERTEIERRVGDRIAHVQALCEERVHAVEQLLHIVMMVVTFVVVAVLALAKR